MENKISFTNNSTTFFNEIKGNDEKNAVRNFFDELLKNSSALNQSSKKIAFISVNHMVPTIFYFLETLEKVGRVAAIIPKSSYQDAEVVKKLRSNSERYPLKMISKEALLKEKVGVTLIKEVLKEDEGCIIIDIGGYFSECVPQICEQLKDKFIGIIEDTENGHQKYEKIKKPNCPIISVARSELKETEDYNVGKSIVEAVDTILRTDVHTIIERMERVGVIGFGKIGRSIARHLREKKIRRIFVYDTNNIMQMKASSEHFITTNKDKILKKCDMIFCATGNKALKDMDFQLAKDNVFIASCTSAEDEFDLRYLEEETKGKERLYKNIHQFHFNENKKINLIRRGNAVNFTFNAVNGPYIYAVQAELIMAAILLRESAEKFHCGQINSLPENAMKRIASIWLKHFEESINHKLENSSPQVDVDTSNRALSSKRGRFIGNKTFVLGSSDFTRIIEEQRSYHDNSLFISDIIDDQDKQVKLIIRPKRFFKTTSLEMLNSFFNIEQLDSRRETSTKEQIDVFKDLNIANEKEGEYVKNHRSKYPVVYLDLKGIGINTTLLIDSYQQIAMLMKQLYRKYTFLTIGQKIANAEKEQIEKILLGEVSEEEKIKDSLNLLIKSLHKYYDKKIIVLIDEYDAPLVASSMNGYYEKMEDFLKIFFATAIDDQYAEQTIITGVLPLSKNKIFEKTKLRVCSVLSQQYNQYFGLTQTEVKQWVTDCKIAIDITEIKKWYGGYNIGGEVLYNPWSIFNFIIQNYSYQTYWATENEVIDSLLMPEHSDQFIRFIKQLLNGQVIEQPIKENINLIDIKNYPEELLNILVYMGYLTAKKTNKYDNSKIIFELSIPNEELRQGYFEKFLLLKNPINSAKSEKQEVLQDINFLSAQFLSKINITTTPDKTQETEEQARVQQLASSVLFKK